MTNRDLLKEAIADAKAVKDTAITNAKLALEEAFTPFLKEKLSAKLAEMEEEDGKETVKEEVDEVTSEEKVDEYSLEELLAELNEEEPISETKTEKDETKVEEAKKDEEEELAIEDMSEDDLKKFIEDVIKDMVADGELEAGEESEETEEDPLGIEGTEEVVTGEEEIDEEVNLEELLAELEEDKVEEVVKPITEKAKDSNIDKTEGELKEAYETIKTLKNDLNEINLLNAKLLYTNKIFRNKSLNESQKIKVLSAFDKATTKKEVELVYETLKEGLKQPLTTKSSIKESLSSASKPLGNASKPIIENEAFARMRELAGLNKK